MDGFGEALLACHAAVYRYARGLSRDPVDAEELVQETFRRALGARNRPGSYAVDQVRPWMFRILRNHWYNEVRQRKMGTPIEDEPESTMACRETPEQIVTRRYLQSEVRDAVDGLPESYREVIVLREMESMTYSEIAALLDCPIGTVMSRLARARAVLRQTLASSGLPAKGAARR